MAGTNYALINHQVWIMVKRTMDPTGRKVGILVFVQKPQRSISMKFTNRTPPGGNTTRDAEAVNRIGAQRGALKMPQQNNQESDLNASKRHQDVLIKAHQKGIKLSREQIVRMTTKFPLTDWTLVEGALVLRAGASRYVAQPSARQGSETLPSHEKKSARIFKVIDLKNRVYVKHLKRKDVYYWLWQASQTET
jgi:hypothetical protein